jgi:hypothetical protein
MTSSSVSSSVADQTDLRRISLSRLQQNADLLFRDAHVNGLEPDLHAVVNAQRSASVYLGVRISPE